MDILKNTSQNHIPWNKGKLIGQKPALKINEVWAIRIRLQISNRIRDLALFNMALDGKLRGCDLVKLRISDIAHGLQISKRAIIVQQKTPNPNVNHPSIPRLMHAYPKRGVCECAHLC